jgi:transposase
VLILTPGNTADCVMAQECVSLIPGIKELLADKGYDTDAFRAFLKDQKIKPVIPGKSNRKKRIRHDKSLQEPQRHRALLRKAQQLPPYRRATTSSPETSSPRSASLLSLRSYLSPDPRTRRMRMLTFDRLSIRRKRDLA